jgi:hypothetical protein
MSSRCDVCKYMFPVTVVGRTQEIMAWCDTLLTRLILLYLVSLFVIINSTKWCSTGEDVLFWVVDFFLGAVVANAAWFFIRVFITVHFPAGVRDAFENYIVHANNKEP